MSVSYGQLKESGFNPLFLSKPQWVWLLPLMVLASWCQIGCRISKDHTLTCYVHMHKEAIPSLSLFCRVRNHVLIDLLKQTIVQNWVTCSLRNQIYKRKKSHKLAKIDMINHWSCGGLIIHWKHKVSVWKKKLLRKILKGCDMIKKSCLQENEKMVNLGFHEKWINFEKQLK